MPGQPLTVNGLAQRRLVPAQYPPAWFLIASSYTVIILFPRKRTLGIECRAGTGRRLMLAFQYES